MGFSDWIRGRSSLQIAIERGLAEGGNVSKELDDLEDDYVVKSRGDGMAICDALEKIAAGEVSGKKSPLHSLTALFQQVKDGECDAFEILQEHGTELLIRIVDQALENPETASEHDILFILKILAMYGTEQGTEAVIRAARQPFAADGYMWSVILGSFTHEHPMTERVFNALNSPLPEGFMAVGLLDAANQYFMKGGEGTHPFDSEEGVERLEKWLADSNPKRFSYATSATAALPFVRHSAAEQLLRLAMAHTDAGVQIEAAWAAAKLGQAAGIQKLAALCLDVNHAQKARHYLEELGRTEAVPPTTPEFEAKSEFAQWLAHPNELGQAPDSIEVLDHRDLRWPPEYASKHFWLLRYFVKSVSQLEDDQLGVGLVGSVTFSFFSYDLDQRPPEDAYAIHCCWEMEGEKLMKEEAVAEDSTEYDSLLSQWAGHNLTNARITDVAELAPTLKYPRGLVAVASAKMDGVDGWVVLDGPDSAFYSADEFPPEQTSSTVLSIHIGRRLLGFTKQPSRKQFLKPRTSPSPEVIIAAYEKLLSETTAAPGMDTETLEKNYKQLSGHFEAYVDALYGLRGGKRPEYLAAAYEKLLEIARSLEGSLGERVHDTFSAVGNHFEHYVEALTELQRAEQIRPWVSFFTPRWQHNLGYGVLGTAAFKSDDWDTAEGFFLKLREGLEDWERCEEMDFLAEIWKQRGKEMQAKTLLLDCLKGVLKTSQEAPACDRKYHEEEFQNHRRAFLKLFPECGGELHAQNIPESTFKRRADGA